MADSSVNLNLNNTNVRQITSYDIENPPKEKASRISIDTDPILIYVKLTQEDTRAVEVIYVTLNIENTQKIGYSCSETAKKLPVYIMFEHIPEYKEFYIGITSMLEIQPETQKNVNGDNYNDLNGRVYSVKVKNIKVPYKYRILQENNIIEDEYIINNFQVDYLTNSQSINEL